MFFLIGFFVLALPFTAFAYLDPGSGSYIVQMIIAAVLGGVYAIRLYWAKILNIFKGEPQDIDPDDELND